MIFVFYVIPTSIFHNELISITFSSISVTTLDRMSESLIGHIAGEEDFGHKVNTFRETLRILS